MRVLLADDDPHVHSAVRLLLEDEPNIALVGDCASAEALLEQVVCARADAVLIDWDLPGLELSGELPRLQANAPHCSVVALSGRPEERAQALQSGARRFVCKGDAPEVLLEALRSLANQGQ